MDDELKQYLDGMEGRIVERLGGRIDAVEDRLKDYTRQADHDLETKVITG